MTDRTLRDKIVGVLNTEGAFCGTCDREPGDSLYCKRCERVLSRYADAVLAVLDLDTERAEAQVEALREAALDDEATAAQLTHGMPDVFSGLSNERFMRRNEATELMRSGGRLRARAHRIAREAGIEQEATDE